MTLSTSQTKRLNTLVLVKRTIEKQTKLKDAQLEIAKKPQI